MATKVLKTFWALWLVLVFSPTAFAQRIERASADAHAPPVERASFHQLVFANDDFAVLNNRYPPGGDSGFHTHYRDLFYVVIQSAPSSSQRLGRPLTAAPSAPIGAAGFSPVGGEPRVHRVVNGEEGPSQFIAIELLRPRPAGDAVSSREGAPQYVQIVDNERMRAWRLILERGQSAPAISQGGDGLRVIVRGGLLTTTTPGSPDQTLLVQAGEFALQSGGTTRALHNSGSDTIELVEIELK
ncbi:MAG: hypothetical protein KF700_01000 [Hyphomonadaceae bacterium]|nr:hypothetical protein [Hyphomonadaceae bacterium]